jgi:hypothetical protein
MLQLAATDNGYPACWQHAQYIRDAAAAEAMTITDAFGRITVQQMPGGMVGSGQPQHQPWPHQGHDVIDPALQQMVYVPQTVMLVSFGIEWLPRQIHHTVDRESCHLQGWQQAR